MRGAEFRNLLPEPRCSSAFCTLSRRRRAQLSNHGLAGAETPCPFLLEEIVGPSRCAPQGWSAIFLFSRTVSAHPRRTSSLLRFSSSLLGGADEGAEFRNLVPDPRCSSASSLSRETRAQLSNLPVTAVPASSLQTTREHVPSGCGPLACVDGGPHQP